MKTAGIDFSYTSPAICVGEDGAKFNDLKFFAFKQRKKQSSSVESITLLEYPEWITQQERFHMLTKEILTVLIKEEVKLVFLEGYAYGGSGLVFDIAEATGVLKDKLWQAGISLEVVTPSHVKKIATGKGNCGKDLMMEKFAGKTTFNIIKAFGGEKFQKPMDDIIDSYWIREAGLKKGT